MKETTLDNLIQDPRAVVAAAKADRILITDQGRPLAMLVGYQNKDQEDLDYESSAEFWQMIEERRKDPRVVRLQDVMDELLEKDDSDEVCD